MTQDITAAVSRVICPGYLRISSGPCPGYMREFGCVNFTFTPISPNVLNHAATSKLQIAHICWILLWAKIARQKHTIAPSYEQKTAKLGEIYGTVNLGFKRPVHEGYMGMVNMRSVLYHTMCYVPVPHISMWWAPRRILPWHGTKHTIVRCANARNGHVGVVVLKIHRAFGFLYWALQYKCCFCASQHSVC